MACASLFRNFDIGLPTPKNLSAKPATIGNPALKPDHNLVSAEIANNAEPAAAATPTNAAAILTIFGCFLAKLAMPWTMGVKNLTKARTAGNKAVPISMANS